MCGSGWGGMHGGGACVAGGACVTWGACMAGGMCDMGGGANTTRYDQWVGSTHPTGMHSCYKSINSSLKRIVHSGK